MEKKSLYTVNAHLVKQCNLKCKFCYAHFSDVLNEEVLSKEDIYRLIDLLTNAGCLKLNFAGGEPMLHPHLGEFILYASEVGIKTSIVTNGTRLTKSWLEKYGDYLNWIALSCDSAVESTQQQLGRGIGTHVECTKKAFKLIQDFNKNINRTHKIRTKLNSVITSLNWTEDMSVFVKECNVERWKILQVLKIEGENDSFYSELVISEEQFDSFVKKHRPLEKYGIKLAPEGNEEMIESYLMIDPKGCFYQNSNNVYVKSDPILKIGIENALAQVGFREDKFINRGGLYSF